MDETKPTAYAEAPAAVPRLLYKDMTTAQKRVFVFQVVVCVCTFGFVYPNAFG
jgi:hypothetical protein